MGAMDADLGDLLARGGWELVDPRPVAQEHPDTFELPTAAELAGLRAGSQVRAMFRMAAIADLARDGRAPYDDRGRPVLVPQVERMWLVVTGVADGAVDAVLQNQPYATHTRLTVNDRLRVPLTHLIATDAPIEDYDGFLAFLARWEADPEFPAEGPSGPVDPLAAPRIRGDQQQVCERAGVRPEPAWPFGAALLARNVTPESEVVHGARFEPRPDRQDTGWVFLADSADFEEVATTVGFDVVRLQDVHRAHPAAWPYIALPAGWGFTLAGGAEDVYEVEIEE
jgi:hypothetical protein